MHAHTLVFYYESHMHTCTSHIYTHAITYMCRYSRDTCYVHVSLCKPMCSSLS